jgi:hypothetical protein
MALIVSLAVRWIGLRSKGPVVFLSWPPKNGRYEKRGRRLGEGIGKYRTYRIMHLGPGNDSAVIIMMTRESAAAGWSSSRLPVQPPVVEAVGRREFFLDQHCFDQPGISSDSKGYRKLIRGSPLSRAAAAIAAAAVPATAGKQQQHVPERVPVPPHLPASRVTID